MKITREKSISVFANEQLTKYEFCRMDSSKQAIKGAVLLLSTPFIVSMVIGAYSMSIKPEKRQNLVASKVKRVEKEVAPLLEDEMWLQEVHPNPVIEVEHGS